MIAASHLFHRPVAWFLVGLAVLCGASQTLRAQEQSLRWKFSVGQQRYFRWSQNTAMDLKLDATDKVLTSAEQIIDFSWQVEKIRDDGSAVISQQIERIRWKVTGPVGQTAEIDSSSAKPPQGFGGMVVPMVRVLTEKPATLVISPLGQVREVQADDALLETLRTGPGKKIMGELTLATALESLVRRTALPLPKSEKLKLDQQWTDTVSLSQPLLGTLQLATTYQYQGSSTVKDRQLERFNLSLVTTQKHDLQSDEHDISIVEEKSTGQALFDRAEGWVVSSETKHDLKLQMKVGGQDAPLTLHQTTKLERISANDVVKKPSQDTKR